MIYLFIFLTPAINFLLFESFFFKANLFYPALLISNFLILLAARIITGKKITRKEFWNFSIWPILFSSSLAVYSLLLVNQIVIQLLFILNLLLSYFYLKNIYYSSSAQWDDGGLAHRSSAPRSEGGDFLENISAYGNLLTIFFSFAAIYGLEAFLGLPLWILILSAAVIVGLVIYQVFWANKFFASPAYIFLAALLLAQLAWAIYFLPFNYNALGLIAAVCYYLLIGLIKSSLAGKLTGRGVKFYLVSGSAFLILLLLTAKWI
jgi:hypothetical protein